MEFDTERLLSYIERIEHLTEEVKGLQNDIKEVFEEVKSANFDTKAVKEILKLRRKDESERQAEDFILSAYKKALGMD